MTDVVVFTTAPSATLFINGKQTGKMEADKYATVTWENVKLNKGKKTLSK